MSPHLQIFKCNTTLHHQHTSAYILDTDLPSTPCCFSFSVGEMEEEIEKFHKTDDGKEEKKEEAVEDDFVCSCCFEILLEPTTLTCGHTFCRFCLANWWDMSRKAECLQCRRPFNEFPNVNFTLRLVAKFAKKPSIVIK